MADPDSRTGRRTASPELIRYVDSLHAPHDAALARAFDSPERAGLPAIQVGPAEGKLLGLLLRLVGAAKVVEVGSLAGYSAIHMARALPPGGRLWTIESEPMHAAITRENVELASLTGRVEVLEGPALEVLPSLVPKGPFDAVFLDADKGNYDRYGRWAAQNLRRGGLLIGDNAYFFGDLLSDEPAAQAMRRFHEDATSLFDTTCIPTPDGLLLGLKR